MKKIFSTVLALVVAMGATAQVSIDRTKAPEPGPITTPEIASYESFELKNGLKVIVVEDHKLPRINFSLRFDRGPIFEGEKAGYLSLTSDLLGAGTTNRDKATLDEEVDFMGANFNASSYGMSIGGLSKYTDELLDILSDAILNPAFPEEEFEKSKAQTLSSIKANAEDPDYISGVLRDAAIYGLDHPYGETMTEATLESVTLEDCKNFYNAYFKPNAAYLVVIGDITVSDAKKKLNKSLKKWKAGEVVEQTFDKVTPPASTRIVMVDKPSAVQSVVWLGNVIDLPHGHPDIEPLRVANQILGGGMSGRLFTNLREDKAFTYGAYSSFGVDELNSTMSASAKVRNEVTDSALTEFLYEISRMRNSLVNEDELIAAKASLSGSFGRSLESSSSAAGFALDIARYDLPKDYYNTYLSRLNAVTAEDVQRVSQKYLLQDQLTIAVVGRAQDVASKLSAFGKVEYFNSEGRPTEAPTFLFMPDGVTLEGILGNYFEARGGVELLKGITALEKLQTISVPQMPAPLDVKERIVAPSSYYTEQSMQGMVFNKITLEDGVAEMSGMQGNRTLEGEELEAIKDEAANPIPELQWLNEGASLEFDGQTLLDGKDVFQVTLDEDGEKSTLYFDATTHLLFQQVVVRESEEGEFTAVSKFQEWMTTEGGLVFAKVVVQEVMGQTLTLVLKEVKVNGEVTAK